MQEHDRLSEACRTLIARSDRLIAESKKVRAHCETLAARLVQLAQRRQAMLDEAQQLQRHNPTGWLPPSEHASG
jgi:hypothetical protein